MFERNKSNEIKLKKRNWNDISVGDYFKIVEITEDKDLDDMARNIEVLSILCETEADMIWNLSIEEVSALIGQMGWLDKFDFDRDIKFKRIRIGQFDCTVETNLQKMTVAQYIDFQHYFKGQLGKNIVEIVGCFLIPKGCKYNEGYDIADMYRAIRDNMSITTANAVCFFFAKQLVNSTKSMVEYLHRTISTMKRTEKNSAIVEKMEHAEKQAMETLRLLG